MLNRSSLARPLTAAALAIGLAALAACSSSSTLEQPKPDVTNAEVASFQNVQPGSEEDFILNVGRRIYFTARLGRARFGRQDNARRPGRRG